MTVQFDQERAPIYETLAGYARSGIYGFHTPGHKGGRLPSVLPSKRWLPNAMYGGVGMEIFSSHNHYFLRRVGYGLRAEVTSAQHRLDDRAEGTKSGPVRHHTQLAVALVLGW